MAKEIGLDVEIMYSHRRHLRTSELSGYLQGRNTPLIRRMRKYNSDQWLSFCKWCSGRCVAHTEWDIRESRYLAWRKRLYLTWSTLKPHIWGHFWIQYNIWTHICPRKGEAYWGSNQRAFQWFFFPISNISIGCSCQSNVESKHPLVCQNEDLRKSDALLSNTVTVPQPI